MTPDRATNLHGELIRLQEQGSLLIDDEIYISDLPVSTVTDRLNGMVIFDERRWLIL